MSTPHLNMAQILAKVREELDIAMTPDQFARLVRDGHAPGEVVRLTRKMRYWDAEAIENWIDAMKPVKEEPVERSLA